MVPRTLTIFAICTTFGVVSGNLRGNVSAADYVEDKSRANYVFSNPLFNHSSIPRISCIATCLVEKICYGVTYNEEQGQCHGHARFSGPEGSNGTKVWTKKIRCHASYIYDPISDLCFQLFGRYNWLDAIAFCAEDDSRLIIFDTLAKLQFYKSYITEINDEALRTIGGRLVNGVWTWVDGRPMSMSKKFWRTWEPSGSGGFVVAGRYGNLDGLYNDVPHNSFLIVCEKP